MPLLTTDEEIKNVLKSTKTVAIVGISQQPHKPSYFVSEVIKLYGFKIYLINPNYEGQVILGEKVYRSILDIPDEIDIVDVFRRPADVVYTAEEALKKGFKTFWFQPQTYNKDVAKILIEVGNYDEMVVVRDIQFFSLCEHHLLPFFGKAHIAYIPDKKVCGLSKIVRVVNKFSYRPQVQERLTAEIAEYLEKELQPKGVAVVMEAVHLCMAMKLNAFKLINIIIKFSF